jgi:hypothetical protein
MESRDFHAFASEESHFLLFTINSLKKTVCARMFAISAFDEFMHSEIARLSR